MTIIKPQKGDDWDNLCRPSIHHLSPSPRSSKRIILLLYFSFFFLFIYSPLFCLVCDEDANNPGGENTDRGSYPNDFGGRGDVAPLWWIIETIGALIDCHHLLRLPLLCVCVCLPYRLDEFSGRVNELDWWRNPLSLLSFALTDWVTGLVVIPRTYRTQNLSWPADVRVGNIMKRTLPRIDLRGIL